MFIITANHKSFECPNEQALVALAWSIALDKGIVSGPIHDKSTAIDYLNTINVKVEEV